MRRTMLVKYAAFLIITFSVLMAPVLSSADVIYLNDGTDIKGLVIDVYYTHVVFSTPDELLKIDTGAVADIFYDLPEENQLYLARSAVLSGQPDTARAFALKALIIKPDYKEAEGLLAIISSLKRAGSLDRAKIRAAVAEDIGLVLKKDKDGRTIISQADPQAGAYQAGLREGDIIYKLYGVNSPYLPLNITREILAGYKDELSLNIRREIKFKPDRPNWFERLFGIGPSFKVRLSGSGYRVTAVKGDSDAYEAGLREGDLIAAVNSKSTLFMTQSQLKAAIYSEENGIITLTIERNLPIKGDSHE